MKRCWKFFKGKYAERNFSSCVSISNSLISFKTIRFIIECELLVVLLDNDRFAIELAQELLNELLSDMESDADSISCK